MRTMSKRAGQPKPHASERTWRRFRAYHNKSTVGDLAHFKETQNIKDQILEWLGRTPKVEMVNNVMAGKR